MTLYTNVYCAISLFSSSVVHVPSHFRRNSNKTFFANTELGLTYTGSLKQCSVVTSNTSLGLVVAINS